MNIALVSVLFGFLFACGSLFVVLVPAGLLFWPEMNGCERNKFFAWFFASGLGATLSFLSLRFLYLNFSVFKDILNKNFPGPPALIIFIVLLIVFGSVMPRIF